MSFTLRAEHVICTLKDHLIGQRGPVDHCGQVTIFDAIVVKLDLSMSHSGYLADGNTLDQYGPRDWRHVAFVMLYGNTSVWIAVEEAEERWFSPTDVPLDRWKNTSNHDSCWRTDGVSTPLFNLFVTAWESLTFDMDEKDRPAPSAMHQFCQFGLCGSSPWTMARVHVARVWDEDEGGRRNHITSIAI